MKLSLVFLLLALQAMIAFSLSPEMKFSRQLEDTEDSDSNEAMPDEEGEADTGSDGPEEESMDGAEDTTPDEETTDEETTNMEDEEGIDGVDTEDEESPEMDMEDMEDEEDPEDPLRNVQRECLLSEDVEAVEFECEMSIEDGETMEMNDKIDFVVSRDMSRGVVVTVQYIQEVETAAQETETETSFEIVFERVVEYVKAAGATTEAYVEGDSELQSIPLTDLGDFSAVDDDGTTASFSISTMDGLAMFQFTITRSMGGTSITANQMKIDFALSNFAWQSSDSYVALVSEVVTEREVEVDYEGTIEVADVMVSFEDILGEAGAGEIVPFGEFTWANEAVAGDNTTVSVVATSVAGDVAGEQYITFSFVGQAAQSTDYLYWDPEAGVGYVVASDAPGTGGNGDTPGGEGETSGVGSFASVLSALLVSSIAALALC